MTARRHLPSELIIGVVGPYDLVERIMLSGAAARDEAFGAVPPGAPSPGQPAEPPAEQGSQGPGQPGSAGLGSPAWPREDPYGLTGGTLPRRLIAAAYRREREAPEKVARLGAAIDVCLFATPVPYEYARRAGVISVPSTYVRLDGGALYAALLRASRVQGHDIERISMDVLPRESVEEAYAELGLSPDGVRLRQDPGSPAALAAFHERLWRMGETSAALTCLESVSRRLARAGVPVVNIRPTDGAIRMAVWNAVLLGGHHRLEAAQLAVVAVEVPRLREGARRALSRYSRDELRLSVHRFLTSEAQRIQGMVMQADDHSFLVAATRGSLAAVTGDFSQVPFADRARAELGITIEVGVGMGRTAQEAETHARTALIRSRSGGAGPAPGAAPGGPDDGPRAAPGDPARAPLALAGNRDAGAPGQPARGIGDRAGRGRRNGRPPAGRDVTDRTPAAARPRRRGAGVAAAAEPGRAAGASAPVLPADHREARGDGVVPHPLISRAATLCQAQPRRARAPVRPAPVRRGAGTRAPSRERCRWPRVHRSRPGLPRLRTPGR